MSGYSFVLKGIWVRMIADGIKKEEYRNITPYWLQRLFGVYEKRNGFQDLYFIKKKEAEEWCGDMSRLREAIKSGKLRPFYKCGTFYHGYATDRPQFEKEIPNITIGYGNPGWGAEKGKLYFVIELV